MVASSHSDADESDKGKRFRAVESSWAEPPLLVNRQRAVRADWDRVREFLRLLHSGVSQASFSVCLLSDRAIRRYNRQYRHLDAPTDVLSFPAEASEANGYDYLGDILISVETAQKNARRLGLRLEQEINVLALHGLLHLMGYDHENDHGQMARLEKRWRERFGLPTSLTERSRASRSR
ncbi:MAG: rRNA maturation RNase YbeY [Acidobacteria bacterium]|nr:rRNA maturation RNase YbeY [Acidobacteriota bacterium]